MVVVRCLEASEAYNLIDALADLLIDCVEGGASVSFLLPLSRELATNHFRSAIAEVEAGHRQMLAAFVDSELVGSVQLILATPPNQPHRGEVAKLLVRRSARKQGIATRLMEHIELSALKAGKTLLTLDTITGGSAERLYASLGWTKAGVIPGYSLVPDGSELCATTIFWKQLA